MSLSGGTTSHTASPYRQPRYPPALLSRSAGKNQRVYGTEKGKLQTLCNGTSEVAYRKPARADCPAPEHLARARGQAEAESR